MSEHTAETIEKTPDAPRYGWLSVVIAAVFGAFYAYDLWEAIGNLVNLPPFYAMYGFDAAQLPWPLLWLGVLIPPLVFGAALLLGRRAGVLGRALTFLAGLALVAALSLTVIGLEQFLRG